MDWERAEGWDKGVGCNVVGKGADCNVVGKGASCSNDEDGEWDWDDGL